MPTNRGPPSHREAAAGARGRGEQGDQRGQDVSDGGGEVGAPGDSGAACEGGSKEGGGRHPGQHGAPDPLQQPERVPMGAHRVQQCPRLYAVRVFQLTSS